MASCIQEVTSYIFKVNDKYIFKTSGTVTKELGFKKIDQEIVEDKKEEDEEDNSLPLINMGELIPQHKEAESKEHWTQPPPRYNEATLVKELEEKGIGRPSTYAAIISNITEREYVEKFQNRFKPTELGEVLCKILVKAFPEQFNIKFTAEVEKKLDLIEEGEESWVKILTEFWDALKYKITEAYTKVEALKPKSIPTGLKCEKCELGKLDYTWKRNLTSLSCNRCDYSNPAKLIETGKFELQEIKKEEEKICPKCQGIMRLKNGKFGEFWACSNYPTCSHTIQKPKTTGVVCPQCQKGHFIEKLSKNGKQFWACDYYPNCKNIVWNEPVAQKCEHCLHPLLQKVNGKLRCVSCNKENNPIK
jgi:DNA topoisomerase-1